VLQVASHSPPTLISEDVGFEYVTTWYEWMINASEVKQHTVMELVIVPELPEAAGGGK
jgi:hypothetical protein